MVGLRPEDSVYYRIAANEQLEEDVLRHLGDRVTADDLKQLIVEIMNLEDCAEEPPSIGHVLEAQQALTIVSDFIPIDDTKEPRDKSRFYNLIDND
jgi:hypothetical protein